jgi:hypothetical protein
MSRALLNGIHRVTAPSFCQIAKDHRRPQVEFSPDEHVPPKNGIGLHPLSAGAAHYRIVPLNHLVSF